MLEAPNRRFLAAAVLAVAASSTGCAGGVEGMIVSGVVQAAVKTAITEADRNKPTSEQLWRREQVAGLERRAGAGDVDAQFRLGTYYMWLRSPAAERWLCEAANRGHPKAQLQYGHLFNEDRLREDLYPFVAATPDNATAYLWYSLAAQNGEPRAAHFRDRLVEVGMGADLERGRAHVASWSPGACPAAPSFVAYGGTPDATPAR